MATTVALALAPAQPRADAGQQALTLYQQGRVTAAIGTLEADLAAAPPADKFQRTDALLELCIMARDRACLDKHLPSYAALGRSSPVDPAILRGRIATAATLLDLLDGNDDSLRKVLADDISGQWLNPALDPVFAIEMHLLAAEAGLRLNDMNAFETAIDRSLGLTFAYAPRRSVIAARALTQTLGLLLQAGAIERMLVLLTEAQPFLTGLADNSLERLRAFDLLSAAGLKLWPHDPAAEKTAHEYLRLLKATDAKDAAGLHGIATLRLAALYIVTDKYAEARTVLETHSLAAQRQHLMARDSFPDEASTFFAMLDVYVDFLEGKPADEGWLKPLGTVPAWLPDGTERFYPEAYRSFARAMIAVSHRRPAGETLVETLASKVALWEATAAENPGAFQIADTFDDHLLQLLVPWLVESRLAAPLVPARDMFGRTSRDFLADALSAMAQETNPGRRHLRQVALRTDRQKLAWQAARVRDLVQTESGKTLSTDESTAVLRTAADFAAISESIRQPAAASGLPRVAELQNALDGDEALIAHLRVGVGLLGLCVRRSQTDASYQRLEPSFGQSLKLLNLSLTATHPASDKADSQYPVAAAVTLHDALFKPLSACLAGARRVIVVPPSGLAGLPMGALLEAEPPRDEIGFDLRRAAWVAARYDLSYATSFSAFLASRKLAQTRRGWLPYLGIGDPAYDAAASPVADLPPLPETRDEIATVAAAFPGAATLLGTEATEERLRQQPLGGYDVIHLATHGLIRDELPGLTEPALALTPQAGGGTFNDGLLTAAELAAVRLNARLVVLSACNSAEIDLAVSGNEVQGLVTALAISGVPSVTATLWPVDSAAAQQIMKTAFARITADAPLVTAFGEAQRAMIRGTSRALAHPRFWSAFILWGEGGTVLGPAPPLAQHIAVRASGTDGEVVDHATQAHTTGHVYTVTTGPRASLQERAADGTVVWRTDLEGAGITALAFDAIGPLVGEARFIETGNERRTLAALAAYDRRGQLRWRRDLAANVRNAHVFDLATLPDGTIVAGLGRKSQNQGEAPADAWSLLTLSHAGAQLAETIVPLKEGRGREPLWDGLRLAPLADGNVLLVTTAPREPGAVARDAFGLERPCLMPSGTRLAVFDPDTGRILRDRFHPALGISAVRIRGRDVLFAGYRRSGCQQRQSAVAGRITADLDTEPVWEDDLPMTSTATGIAWVRNRLFVAGYVDTPIRPQELAGVIDDPRQDAAQGFKMRESYIVDIARPDERVTYSAGLSSVFTGLTTSGGHVIAFGYSGPGSLWVRLR